MFFPTLTWFSPGLQPNMALMSQQDHKGMHFMNGRWMKDSDMAGMGNMHHTGSLADVPHGQEASGTAWLPGSSPHYMLMLPTAGRYAMGLMGQVQAGYTSPGSRGEPGGFIDSMAMLTASRGFVTGDKVAFHFMTSIDRFFDGERGVPNLFQTGETAYGQNLVDRQHPHNLFSELAFSESHPLGSDWRGFVYGGPVGEPALGGPMFMHRPSGMEVPEAPITHHWFDSTHISNGVVTLGLIQGAKWKLDASAFNGREPSENRLTIDPIRLDSESGRVTFNPDENWSLSTSYGYLRSPEWQDPSASVRRTTASVYYNRGLGGSRNIAVGIMFGRNAKASGTTDAYNLEATLSCDAGSIFTRLENVDKDELPRVPPGTYNITKWVFGAVKNLSRRGGYELGIGGYAGIYGFPSSLRPFYGKNPVTLGVFLRIRPARM